MELLLLLRKIHLLVEVWLLLLVKARLREPTEHVEIGRLLRRLLEAIVVVHRLASVSTEVWHEASRKLLSRRLMLLHV